MEQVRPGGSLDNVILIPVNTASRRLFNRDYLTMLIAQLRDPFQADAATTDVRTLLRDRHKIRPPELDDFTVTNPRATMARVTRPSSTLSRILTGVSIMALLIGGAVIMGLMLVAVSERRKEVGVRRSVGASQSDIVVQFMLEALFVAVIGGFAGVAIGGGVVLLGAQMRMMPANLLWQPFAQGILLSVVIGLLCGIYPAWKASRIDPIRAIRRGSNAASHYRAQSFAAFVEVSTSLRASIAECGSGSQWSGVFRELRHEW